MWKRCISLIALLAALPTATFTAQQQQQRQGPPPSIEDRTSGMRKMDGYFPMYWDERTGSVFLEIPRFDTEFLFATGLSAGLGSNDIGLDRGAGEEGVSCCFSASARACCSCSLINRSVRAAVILSSVSRSRTRSRNLCSGDSVWRPRAAVTSLLTPPTFSSATCWVPRPRCVLATTASIAPAVRSTSRIRRAFRRTLKST